jgi:hypothetical protein
LPDPDKKPGKIKNFIQLNGFNSAFDLCLPQGHFACEGVNGRILLCYQNDYPDHRLVHFSSRIIEASITVGRAVLFA